MLDLLLFRTVEIIFDVARFTTLLTMPNPFELSFWEDTHRNCNLIRPKHICQLSNYINSNMLIKYPIIFLDFKKCLYMYCLTIIVEDNSEYG